jgi:hypothetical protein
LPDDLAPPIRIDETGRPHEQGRVLSFFFRDPEGLEAEVCVGNPDAMPGVVNPPGTPSARYHASRE